MNARYGFRSGLFAIILVVFAFSGCAGKARDAGDSSGTVANGPAGASGAQGSGSSKWAGTASGGSGGRKVAVVPVQALSVAVGLLSVDRNTAGVVAPVMQSQVASQVAGIVQRVPHAVGDWVKNDEIVMQLDSSQLVLTLANAQSTLENAKINLSINQDSSHDASPKLVLQVQSAQSALDSAQKYYDAQKALYDLGGISASQLDTAASQLATARANLEGAKTSLSQNGKAEDQTLAQYKLAVTMAQNQVDQAKLNLRNASIRAPFTGQIAAINMQPGMYTGLNTPVFTLVSSDRHITFNVPPSDAAFLKEATAIAFNFQGKDYSARISQSPSAPVSGVVPMVAVFSSGAGTLSYGSVGTIEYRIPLATGALVPLSSLQTLEDQNYVFVIENDKVTTKNVTILAEAGTTAAVDGVVSGDTVIVSPPPGLIKGARVQATMVDSSALAGKKAASGKPAADATVNDGPQKPSDGMDSSGKKGGSWPRKKTGGASGKNGEGAQ